MSKNAFDLHSERLGTVDEFGHRVYIHPDEVQGFWKQRRKNFYWFLIGLYLVLPWFNINGRPALQIDIFSREFTFLGFTLHGVEPILFFLMVASGIFFIAFLTSLLGRVWCGWACPQTVFIQSIFWKIDELFEGKARQRRQVEKAPMSLNKLLRRTGKWLAFLLVAIHIAHTFVGYFVGPRNLFWITTHAPAENIGLFTATMILTGIFLLDFGWFREQFCLIACPYGRMQSVLMDENSLVVSYDVKRGEPRRNPVVEKAAEGDCINCYNCVKVCPTGIDIRRGTQLECIACTQCIDACDEIMTKLKKPTGLIRYSSENEINGKPHRKITIRSMIYVSISILFISAFAFFFSASTNLNMVFLRGRIPFQVVEDTVINQFILKLTHQGDKVFRVNFELAESDLKDTQIVTVSHPTVVDKAEKKIVMIFKFAPEKLQAGTRKATVNAVDVETHLVIASKEVTLVGPAR